MHAPRVVVIGAGIGGLAAALELAASGADVTVLERASGPGGKMRTVDVGGAGIDAGPTVFTMRWVFEALFESVGLDFADVVHLDAAQTLARHAWCDGSRLDLHADLQQTVDAISIFAGADEGRHYREFTQRARKIYTTLEKPFIRSARTGPLGLMRNAGVRGFGDLLRISPFTTLWPALGKHFRDPRLQQLFARYATYCGSSPFLAPATLMLVAHVEQDGVWYVKGGMHQLALAVQRAAERFGATFRFDAEVAEIHAERGRVEGITLQGGERIGADAVVVNADSAALTSGAFGAAAARAVPASRATTRSLSAITWLMQARTSGFPLQRHNVFFSTDYAREFSDIFGRAQVPSEPTVYVCAQDRDDNDMPHTGTPERLLCLVNAPANGDTHAYTTREIRSCEERSFGLLARCGLDVVPEPEATRVVTPTDFNRLFPATGGALYGPASHGWMASFNRAGSTSRLRGLYLAGGSTHPGPGVPMATLSGRLAAARLLKDFASIRSFHPMAMPGGTSTR
ncbi:MAG: 1-hydroxycarotenoid 3,4-desaturase CrtD [Dokdonella sp.]|uniref:1-hydroxycarotenoid 3,4-desaturase CrtD n=1 Tax=Dokdonella sp. TaxID=2291710 RepID=UPI0032638452